MNKVYHISATYKESITSVLHMLTQIITILLNIEKMYYISVTDEQKVCYR